MRERKAVRAHGGKPTGYPIEKLRMLNDVAKAAANAAFTDPLKKAERVQDDPEEDTPSSRMAMPTGMKATTLDMPEMTWGGMMDVSRKRNFAEIASGVSMCAMR